MSRPQTTVEPGPVATRSEESWFDRWMGWSERRVIGVDVARGLAMIGMFGAHLHVEREVVAADPGTWLGLVHGRSAIGFALLAGIALALVSGGPRPVTGPAMVDLRLRTLVRAILLFALGGLLAMLGTPVVVILESYAVLFVLLLPALGWSARRLWLAVAVLAVVGPVVTIAVRTTLVNVGVPLLGAWDLAFGEFYPVATWLVFPLAGLALGRTDLRALGTQLRLVLGGGAAAVVGYWLGHLATEARDASDLTPLEPSFDEPLPPLRDVLDQLPGSVLHDLLTAQPHSGTPFEILGSGGFVVAVLGLCLLLTRGAGRFWLAPVAAVGALSLTVYSVHIVAIRLILPDLYVDISLDYFAAFTCWALLGATAWRLAFGQGPLERAIGFVARRTARAAGPG